MVVPTHVQPYGLGVMALQRRAAKLTRTNSSHIDPESLGCLGVRVLVDADAEDQIVSLDTSRADFSSAFK